MTEIGIHWAPNSPPQTRFLASPAFELLYGGRAGGGKTHGLVVNALGLQGTWTDKHGVRRASIEHPRYEAIILRKYSKDLDEIRRLADEIYKPIPGVYFAKGADRFVFKSGATIELGGVPEADSHERYKSRSFQWVGWEELTEHATDTAYLYLTLSRVRPGNGMPNDFPCYVRSTTNPDGPGMMWVKERWNIEDDGGDVPLFVGHQSEVNGKVFKFWREFISAGAVDNPDLPDDYTARMDGMSAQKRRALRDGRWDVPTDAHAIFAEQFLDLYERKRVTTVPYVTGYPVNTFWDHGVGDKTAIWFHQRIGREDCFIDYYENAHMPLVHYVEMLQSKRYFYGMHYLPHDAEHQRQGGNEVRTIREMLEDLGIDNTEIVPRVRSIAEGIEQSRQALSSCTFDKDRCAVGLAHLKMYRYKFDPKTATTSFKPLHDEHSDAADAFRQFAQGYYEQHGNVFADPSKVDARPAALGRTARSKRRPDAEPADTSWAEV